ncbi:MAG: ABC transporter permease subunit [Desulfurococcales archaeon]|nr:ABC transporter permease subunit [Desulfurococcales archaeon]
MRRRLPERSEKLRRILVLAGKDLRDLLRDRRTIAAIIILPFLGLPAMALLTGLLAGEQQVVICVRLEDTSPEAERVVSKVLNLTVSTLRSWGFEPVVALNASGGGCDIQVIVPEGFGEAASSLGEVAVLSVSSSLTSAGQQALYALQQASSQVGSQLAAERVSKLAEEANVSVDPWAVLSPLRVKVQYHTATGQAAPESRVRVAEAARVLAFSLFFVVNPVVVFMSDAIAGERERRTLEMLLISPLTRGELLAGKVVAAGVAGLLGAVADSAGILAYFALAGLGLSLTLGLALVWLGSVLGLIGFTAFLTAVIAGRSRSVRASQNMSFLVTTLALLIYFAALVVDFSRLPQAVRAVMSLVPFTHAALALNYYAVGLPSMTLWYLAALFASTALTAVLAAKLIDYERLLA